MQTLTYDVVQRIIKARLNNLKQAFDVIPESEMSDTDWAELRAYEAAYKNVLSDVYELAKEQELAQ